MQSGGGPDRAGADPWVLGAALDHNGIAAVERRDGTIVRANETARLLVVEPEELAADPGASIGVLEGALTIEGDDVGAERAAVGVVQIRLAGRASFIEVQGACFATDDGTDVVSFAPNGTRPTLEAQVERLEALVEATSDMIVMVDTEGTIRFSNAAAGRITGLTGSEANGTGFLEHVHPDDADVAMDGFVRGVVAGEEIEPVNLRVRFADGAWHHVEAEIGGNVEVDGVTAYVVTLRDVTDRVLREAESEATRRLLQTVVADVEDVVVILDPSLSVKWSSPGIERLVDAPAYTNVGESAFNDIHPDDFPRVALAIEEVMAKPDGRARLSFRLQHRRRGWRSVEAHIRNRLDDPAVRGLVCTLRDVTEHRDSDAELLRLREQDREEVVRLREADQLKDGFLATVSHELRTPLTAVRGFSSFLAEQGSGLDEETRSQLVGRIAANAREMEDMIAQLLDYSRLQAGSVPVSPERLELASTVASLLERLAPHLEDHEVVLGDLDFAVTADRDALGHVLRNLLTNAARYSHAGSTITIDAERGDGEVLVRVTDEGIGISEEDQAKVFQSFYQAAPATSGRRGTGIGLNVARRFAQVQGGRLGLESELGKGSTFTLALPDAD